MTNHLLTQRSTAQNIHHMHVNKCAGRHLHAKAQVAMHASLLQTTLAVEFAGPQLRACCDAISALLHASCDTTGDIQLPFNTLTPPESPRGVTNQVRQPQHALPGPTAKGASTRWHESISRGTVWREQHIAAYGKEQAPPTVNDKHIPWKPPI